MSLDGKSFDFNVFGFLRTFTAHKRTPGPGILRDTNPVRPLVGGACCVGRLVRRRFDTRIRAAVVCLQTGERPQIEAFSIQEHDPRMLKPSNSKSWDPKILNSKVLTS